MSASHAGHRLFDAHDPDRAVADLARAAQSRARLMGAQCRQAEGRSAHSLAARLAARIPRTARSASPTICKPVCSMRAKASTPRASRSAPRAISSPRRRSARSSASCSGFGASPCGSPWASRDPITVAELGPGRGTLWPMRSAPGAVVPNFLDTVSVALVETSPVMREAQRKALQNRRCRFVGMRASMRCPLAR